MKLLNFFKRGQISAETTPTVDEVLLKSIIQSGKINENMAMNIPSVSSSVHLICDTVSMIPIKFYKEENLNGKRKTIEISDDTRTFLMNQDTKDTLDGVQFKRAMVRDYLLNGNSYAYINKKRNKIQSVNYVSSENISIILNTNPIFKDYNISVQGQLFKPFEFIKLLRSTKDGASGRGIIEENSELLNVAYQSLKFEQNLVATGGNKKGFINAKTRLSQETMSSLKQAWKNLYSNSEENVIVLNDGLSFQEASNTSVEMQLNESKKTTTEAIQNIFGIPPNLNYELFIKQAIMPILTAFECSLNKDFLLEKEKRSFYFAFDTKEITKGDIKTRFEAYKTALDSNLMQIDECRYMEDLEPLGLNFIKLGLQDVLYNPQTKEVYTPNTNQITDIKS